MLAETLAVDFTKEDALASILPRPPILSGKLAGWNGFVVEHHCQPAHETPEHCFTQHMVCIALRHPFRSERVLN